MTLLYRTCALAIIIAAVSVSGTPEALSPGSSLITPSLFGERLMASGAVAGCNFGGIDLSGTMKSADYSGNDGSYDYKMNVCGVSNSGGDCTTKGATICQFQPGTTQLVAVLGAYSGAPPPPSWDWISGADHTAGVQMTYTNGDQCWQPGGRMITRTVIVMFPCVPGGGTQSQFSVVEDTSTCTFTIKLNTDQSCQGNQPTPPGPPGPPAAPIGGGSVFLIIAFSAAVIYIVAGCVYKRQKTGTTTMKESCPNNEFWFALPGLVKDGCRYSFNMIRTGCKSGTSEKYEEL